MIFSVSLKKFRFKATKVSIADNVVKCLAAIETACKITKNRLSSPPPENTGDYKSTYPIKLTNPPGVSVVAQEPSCIAGKFDSEAEFARWKQSAPEALLALSQFGRILIEGNIAKFGRTFKAAIDVRNESVFFTLRLQSMATIESERKVEWFQKMSDLLGLPVHSGMHQAVSNVLKLEHKQNLRAEIGGLDKGERWAYMECDLMIDNFAAIFERVANLWKFKSMSFHFASDAKFPFNEDVIAVNRVNFPVAEVTLNYWWHLQSYKDVTALPAMASLTKMDVAQSMFEFEFDNGFTGQLDIAANQRGKFKLIFSFDQQEAAKQFSNLTGIKLEPGY